MKLGKPFERIKSDPQPTYENEFNMNQRPKRKAKSQNSLEGNVGEVTLDVEILSWT